MSGKDIMEALDGIDDRKLMAAMQVYEKKQRGRTILFRVAAMAATLAILLTAALWPRKTEDGGIISVPGVMKVYAHDIVDGEEQKNILTNVLESADYVPSIWSSYLNYFALPFELEIPADYYADMEITYHISVNYGDFWDRGPTVNHGNTIKIKNGGSIYWRGTTSPMVEAPEVIRQNGGIYAEIIIYADKTPVGCGIIEIGYAEEPIPLFFPVRSETLCFPLVDGVLQDVPPEYITAEIAKLKETEVAYTGEEKLAEFMDYCKKLWDEHPDA
ncbi:MAG: hypothetical protein E7436_04980 [Ruminococcaceae bacterium]|nr:hypothetical protein [Oscillospiraceae bacterium]MBE6974824.1 hypothetical protein [Oscillospiraceae bacterium]